MGLRKINTIGIQQAGMLRQLSATTYNLKKLVKFYGLVWGLVLLIH